MNNDQFIRYKALDRCFRNEYGSFDIDDLIEVCTNAVRNYHADPERNPVSRRTIEKDLQDMKDYYNVKFREKLKRGKKKLYKYEDTTYSLMQELLNQGSLEKWLLDGVLNTLSLYDDVPQYKWLYLFLQQRANGIKSNETQAIEFQNNPDLLGMEHFNVILNAIINKHTLEIEYKPYHKDTSIITVFPYLLKQYNDRWFMICRKKGYYSLSNCAIDRIQSVKEIDMPFLDPDVDFEDYFKDVIGVSKDPNSPVEDIFLRISNSRYPYIESKPFQGDQKLIHALCDDNTKVIKLHLQINNELVAQILSFGSDIEVLAPDHFRRQIKQQVDDMLKKYQMIE